MKAITVRQPYAWAIIHGGKPVENRSQMWRHRGPLAIHAGLGWDHRGAWSGMVWSALDKVYGWPVGPVAARDDPRPGFDCIRPLGAIIGVVQLVDCHYVTVDCCESPWAETWYTNPATGLPLQYKTHLVLADPRPVEPIPCKGRLGLWDVPDDLIGRLT